MSTRANGREHIAEAMAQARRTNVLLSRVLHLQRALEGEADLAAAIVQLQAGQLLQVLMYLLAPSRQAGCSHI